MAALGSCAFAWGYILGRRSTPGCNFNVRRCGAHSLAQLAPFCRWGMFRDRRPDLYGPLLTLDGTSNHRRA